jgi:asparagine synthase (glutamine-hydrolysing)
MCGIVCVFDIKKKDENLRVQVLEMSKKLRHRGPDWSGVFSCDNAILAHERLSIVDPQSGGQPLKSKDGKLILSVNGEIYNHLDIRNRIGDSYEFLTNSDCEVILALYREQGPAFLEEMNGIFGFALYDTENDTYMVARDHIGIIPLYMAGISGDSFM